MTTVKEGNTIRKLQHPDEELSTEDVEHFFSVLWTPKYTKRLYDVFKLKEQEYYATWDDDNAVRRYEEYGGSFIVDWEKRELTLLSCNSKEIINKYKNSNPKHYSVSFDDIFSNFKEFEKTIQENIKRKRDKKRKKDIEEKEKEKRETMFRQMKKEFGE